jgi:hypothetical protein
MTLMPIYYDIHHLSVALEMLVAPEPLVPQIRIPLISALSASSCDNQIIPACLTTAERSIACCPPATAESSIFTKKYIHQDGSSHSGSEFPMIHPVQCVASLRSIDNVRNINDHTFVHQKTLTPMEHRLRGRIRLAIRNSPQTFHLEMRAMRRWNDLSACQPRRTRSQDSSPPA